MQSRFANWKGAQAKAGTGPGRAAGIGFLALALVCGLTAAGLVILTGLRLQPSVGVYVASAPIAEGDPLTPQNTKLVKMPPAGLPSDAVKTTDILAKAVAAHAMSPGDIVRESNLVQLDARTGDFGLLPARLAALKDPGLRAVEVPSDASPGLLAGIKPGDKVDIVATEKVGSGSNITIVGRTIIQKASVIGVRPPGESANGVLVVALTQSQFETLAAAREKGKVYVSVLPLGS